MAIRALPRVRRSLRMLLPPNRKKWTLYQKSHALPEALWEYRGSPIPKGKIPIMVLKANQIRKKIGLPQMTKYEIRDLALPLNQRRAEIARRKKMEKSARNGLKQLEKMISAERADALRGN